MSAPTTNPPRAAKGKRSDQAAAPAAQAIPAGGGTVGFTGIRRFPLPTNEPVRGYAPGSPERAELKSRLTSMASERIEIPIVIGGEEIHTGETTQAVMPHAHDHVLADWHRA